MAAPSDREFRVLERGHIRDRVILANFRAGLRKLKNPETGVLFTAEEIARATQVGSRWWIEADGIDLQGQLSQRSAVYLSDQGRAERANSEFLANLHGKMWGVSKLPATGGSGTVRIAGAAGTLVLGSTTVPDQAAYQARDGAGKKYQVFTAGTIGTGGTVDLTMAAVDTGSATNLKAGDKLTWVTRAPGMNPDATVVTADFRGGTDLETDQEFLDRLQNSVRYKAAAGNPAHFRQWARAASNAIEDAFIYPCALHAGSVLVAITQKRGTTVGPLARIPDLVVMRTAIEYLTPPGSPVVPARAFVLVVPVQSVVTQATMRLALSKGSADGWADSAPWPNYGPCAVSSVTSDTDFVIDCPADGTLPGGATSLSGSDAPQMMLWDVATSSFKPLSVSNIHWHAGTAYHVTLTTAPGTTVTPGQRVCPFMSRHAIVSAAVEAYFDELGPNDLFDVTTDPRGERCRRFPDASEDKPWRAGSPIVARVLDALGQSSADGDLPAPMYPAIPGYPPSLSDGPEMHTCGKIGIYAL